MIIDSRTEFADAEALSTSTGRGLVGDVIDLGAANPALGLAQNLFLVVQVATALTSDGSATVDFELVSDAQAAIAVDGSATVHVATGAMAITALDAAGDEVLIVPLPARANYERYLGLIANVATAALTAGAVDAFLTTSVSAFKAYPGVK